MGISRRGLGYLREWNIILVGTHLCGHGILEPQIVARAAILGRLAEEDLPRALRHRLRPLRKSCVCADDSASCFLLETLQELGKRKSSSGVSR